MQMRADFRRLIKEWRHKAHFLTLQSIDDAAGIFKTSGFAEASRADIKVDYYVIPGHER